MTDAVDLRSFIRAIPDFPKPGILFRDITPLLADPVALNGAVEGLVDRVGRVDVDFVIGAEARGFMLGPALALRLAAGFVPARKPGRLPYDAIAATYDLEYATATLELHTDPVLAGANVLVHDDLLATGGTARALCELVTRLGGHVVGAVFLIELADLAGRKHLSCPVDALITYGG